MILLVAPPSSIRAVLISFFEREDLSAKICDSFAAALSAYAKIPQFELVLTDYRIEGDRVEAFMADLAEHERPMPILVFNAPLKAEAELFRRGAIAVLPPGYSPQSLALQCVNLVSLVEQKTASPAVRRQAVADFELGGAMVSPERRSLSRRRRGKGKSRDGRADAAASPSAANLAGFAGSRSRLRLSFPSGLASSLSRE